MNVEKLLNLIGLTRLSQPVAPKRVSPALLTGIEPKPWNKDSAALLKQFLHTGTGRVFIFQLAYFRPSLAAEKTVEATALQGKFVAGYEDALNRILSLAEPPIELERNPEQYPPLDDDSLWGKTKR